MYTRRVITLNEYIYQTSDAAKICVEDMHLMPSNLDLIKQGLNMRTGWRLGKPSTDGVVTPHIFPSPGYLGSYHIPFRPSPGNLLALHVLIMLEDAGR